MSYSNLFLIIIALSILPSWNFNFKLKLGRKTPTSYTGLQVIEQMVQKYSAYDVKVIVKINLAIGQEFYNPSDNTIYLSEEAAYSANAGGNAIVAHEFGHALQNLHNYSWLKRRTLFVSTTKIAQNSMFFMFLALMSLQFQFVTSFLVNSFGVEGFYTFYNYLIYGMIAAFAAVFLFTLITLPVELNASKRAVKFFLESNNNFSSNQIVQIKSVLFAAALTYISQSASSLMNLIYYIGLIPRR